MGFEKSLVSKLNLRRVFVSDEEPKTFTEPPKNIITLNVGGVKFQTTVDTLRKFPNTRLASVAKYYDGRPKQNGFEEDVEFFFDHSPVLFQSILDFYRSGELHTPRGICGKLVYKELQFWGLTESNICLCCWQPYTATKEKIQTYERLHEEFDDKDGSMTGCLEGDSKISSIRKKVWTFLEDWNSSKGAKAYGVLTSMLILVNITTYMMGTLSNMREPAPFSESIGNAINASNESHQHSSNDATAYLTHESNRNAKLYLLLTTQPHFVLFYFDIFCFFFFLVEYLVMLVVSPNRLKFAMSFLAVCDILYLLPLGLMLAIYYIDSSFQENPNTVIGIIVLQGFLAFRVLRIVRVVRHYRGFIVLALSLRASAKELLLLGLLMIVVLLFFANAIFFAELLQYDTFNTVFQGFWWSLITITTIGYGDMYPKSLSGCMVGSACAVAGLILMSLPIPVIANNFNIYYAFKKRGPNLKDPWRGDFPRKHLKGKQVKQVQSMPVTVI